MKRFISLLLVLTMCFSCVSVTVSAKRYLTQEEILAGELKQLGLFRGVSETNFDLGRAPSRVEALVMLIRVLGKETEAMSGTWEHPFSDVPGWADKYVGYAYENGLTNGQSPTRFGVDDANAAMYLTFVLRALGYSDKNGKDFTWDDPFSLARQTGILTENVNVEEFLRADVVIVSHCALSAYIIGTSTTLASKLIDAGVFTKELFDSVYNSYKNNVAPEIPEDTVLTAEQIFEKCSPAVFIIAMYDQDENLIGTGSGFFIDDKGTAVTNYHVIEGVYYAMLQLSDTQEIHDILGVYDYDAQSDWAIIKTDCENTPYLEFADSRNLAGGSRVYAIGSPKGYQNTMTEGIISNPKRVIEDIDFIQTNAPLSPGSSGGALLDKYGKVIGITSRVHTEAQNLNLALPIHYIEGYSTEKLHLFRELLGEVIYEEGDEPVVEYILSDNCVYINTGETKTISLTCLEYGFEDTITYSIACADEDVAYVDWENYDDEDFPWEIVIYGISTGRTYLKIYNKTNDDSVLIPIFVDEKEPQTPYGYLEKWVIDNGDLGDDNITLTYLTDYYEGKYFEYFLYYDVEDDFMITGCAFFEGNATWITYSSLFPVGGLFSYYSVCYSDDEQYYFTGDFNPKYMSRNTRLYWEDTNCPGGLRDTMIAGVATILNEMMINFDAYVKHQFEGLTGASFGFASIFH